MIDKPMICDLMSKIKVMCPAKVKEEDTKALIKLDALLDSPEYAAEEKYDGCNYTLAGCMFFSKENNEKTNNFPHLRDFFIKLDMPNLIVSGEIWYPERTSQYCTHVTGTDYPQTAISFQDTNGYIHYVMYDMIRTPRGTWLMKEPYKNRRKLLEYFYDNYVKGTSMEEFLHISSIMYDNKRQFKDDILARGGEGVVLKKLNSLYVMGKKPAWQWVKIKQKDETDFVIMGFEDASRDYTGSDFGNWQYWQNINGIDMPVTKYFYHGWIGSVILGAYVEGELVKVCTASGIDENLRKDMSERKDYYIGKVAKVGYMELTEAGIPRHPKILEMHPDKIAEDCTWEFEAEK